jgi:hypothetical protein
MVEDVLFNAFWALIKVEWSLPLVVWFCSFAAIGKSCDF